MTFTSNTGTGSLTCDYHGRFWVGMSTLWVELTFPGPDPSAIFILGGTKQRLSNTPDHSVSWHSGLGTHISCTTLWSVVTQGRQDICCAEVTARTFENDCCYNYRTNGQWSSLLTANTSQKSLLLLQHKKSLSYLVCVLPSNVLFRIVQFAWALNSLHHYLFVMLCVTRPFPSIPDYNGRWISDWD